MADDGTGWDPCEEEGCEASQVAGGRCLIHVDEARFQAAADQWLQGEPLDLRGAMIDADLLGRLLRNGEVAGPDLLEPDRRGLTIGGVAHFQDATFTENARFVGVEFLKPVYFDGATFLAPADFTGVIFGDHADFDHVDFQRAVRFRRTSFRDHAGFERARLHGGVTFDGAAFASYVDLQGAVIDEGAWFNGVTFEVVRQLGPFSVDGDLAFDDSVFTERVSIEATAGAVSTRSVVFADGARLAVQAREVRLENADFARASTLSGAGPKQPKLVALTGAQVADLALSGLDLSECRFRGAHGLESLIVEPSCSWLRTRPESRCIDREMIAEEHLWRSADELRAARGRRWRQTPRQRWNGQEGPKARKDLDGDLLTGPSDIAALYRALRKAREDNKDQAGASDLYYGEMEMRRRIALPTGRGRIRALCDRWIIVAYWVLSGYGLKASRAIAALIGVLVVSTVGLHRFGFEPRMPLRPALLFGAESASNLLRVAKTHGYALTFWGEAIQVGLHVIGPLLIGLALLALRARVRR